MKYSEIIRSIDEVFSDFFHDETTTNAQAEKLRELQDLIHDLRISQEETA